MPIPSRRTAIKALVGAFCFASVSVSTAKAQDDYPTRPIELWVGYSPGGGTDTHARILAPFLQEELGQPVVVVNKAGAGGIAMWTELPLAEPNGYTLGIINLPAIAAAVASQKTAFDPLEDFTYLANASADAVTLAFNPNAYEDLGDLLADAKENPGKVSVGVTGKASQDFLTSRSVENEAGVKFKYVVFEGTSEGINAILGGHLDAMGMVVSSASPFYQSGQLGMLGVGTDERLPDFPDVPTFKEQGIDLFGGGALNYKAVGAPAGLPDEIKGTLVDAIQRAVENPEYISKVAAIGAMAHFVGPDELEDLARKHIDLATKFLSE